MKLSKTHAPTQHMHTRMHMRTHVHKCTHHTVMTPKRDLVSVKRDLASVMAPTPSPHYDAYARERERARCLSWA
jgi:hypothetical protein